MADEVISVCIECKSEQNSSRIENSSFYKAGINNVPCQYCAGVTILVNRSEKDSALAQADRQRGLS